MSLAEVTARIAQLQSMFAPSASSTTAVTTTSTSGADFASSLTSALDGSPSGTASLANHRCEAGGEDGEGGRARAAVVLPAQAGPSSARAASSAATSSAVV